MEEARQYSSVEALGRLSLVLYWGSFAALLVGIVGQVAFRGHWLQAGLTLWALFRFLAWVLAIPQASRMGRKQKRAAITNAVIWMVMAVAIGLSVNALLIWGR